MARELEPYQNIERSIIKKFRKEIWRPFIEAVQRYELVNEGDKIAVCISGGKDSMLMAKLMQELQRHSKVKFELVFSCHGSWLQRDQPTENREQRRAFYISQSRFLRRMSLRLPIRAKKNPCYLCARMRRGYLYSKAQELGCNKIALGHHFSDVIETPVMSMFYGGQLQAMLPKLHSKNFEGMELIRPMYCIHEDAILDWKRYNNLQFIQCACRFTENCAICDNGGGGSKRQEIKTLIRRLKRDNPNIEKKYFQQHS